MKFKVKDGPNKAESKKSVNIREKINVRKIKIIVRSMYIYLYVYMYI
jgi:hypothetical protein